MCICTEQVKVRQDVADYEFKLKISGCVYVQIFNFDFEFLISITNFELHFKFRI